MGHLTHLSSLSLCPSQLASVLPCGTWQGPCQGLPSETVTQDWTNELGVHTEGKGSLFPLRRQNTAWLFLKAILCSDQRSGPFVVLTLPPELRLEVCTTVPGLCSAGDRIQGFLPTRQALCQILGQQEEQLWKTASLLGPQFLSWKIKKCLAPIVKFQ